MTETLKPQKLETKSIDIDSSYVQIHICQNEFQEPNSSDSQQQSLLQAHDQFLNNVDFKTRKKFIIKVYGILSLQLFITFLLSFISYYSQGLRDLVVNPLKLNPSPFYWVCFFVCLTIELVICCFKRITRKIPYNYIALLIFTITFAFTIEGACVVSYENYENGAILVIISALMTFAITISLTIYAVNTQNDLTKMGGSLFILVTASLFFVIFSIIFYNEILCILLCAFIAILYGFYLIHDTQLLVGGKTHELSIDDYVIASMLIYVDIIDIFIGLLDILTGMFGKI